MLIKYSIFMNILMCLLLVPKSHEIQLHEEIQNHQVYSPNSQKIRNSQDSGKNQKYFKFWGKTHFVLKL